MSPFSYRSDGVLEEEIFYRTPKQFKSALKHLRKKYPELEKEGAFDDLL